MSLKKIKILDTKEYLLPQWAICALINDDWSGLTLDQTDALEVWLDYEGKDYPRFYALCPSEADKQGFMPYNDIDNTESDCSLVTFVIA